MIRLEHVGKRYPPGIDALAGIDLEIARGELIVLGGHSGAGKSTLLKLIPGYERATSGLVLVAGQNVGALGRAALPVLRRHIGFIFQDQKLLFDRNVLDNVLLPLAIHGFTPREAQRRARAALDKVGLLARERALPIALSGGEQQRLAIARAVVGRPNILIADEPTAHLDAETADDIARILCEFHRVGVTVLIATYATQLFASARHLVLDHGRLRKVT